MSELLLWIVFGGAAGLIFAFSIFYLLSMTLRHNKRRKADKNLILPNLNEQKETDKNLISLNLEGYKLSDSVIVLYNSVLDRRQSSITNFLIFQVTTKVFGFTGVLYSIYGFGFSFFDAPKKLSMLVSFVSLVFVILALYLSPERRISEYIIAWRKYDKLATDMIMRLPFYDGKPGDCPLILKELEKISKEISDIESSIISDES